MAAHVGDPAVRPVQPRVPGEDARDLRTHAPREPGAPPGRPRRRDADLVRHALRRRRRDAHGQRALRARPGARSRTGGARRARGDELLRPRSARQREPALEGRRRPSPATAPRDEGVHAANGRAAASTGSGDRRRADRPSRRPRQHGARRRLRIPLADHRDRGAPRHPRRGSAAVPRVVELLRAAADDARVAGAASRVTPTSSSPTSTTSSRSGARRRPTTSSAPSSGPRTAATISPRTSSTAWSCC